jgi:hypothetical protein
VTQVALRASLVGIQFDSARMYEGDDNYIAWIDGLTDEAHAAKTAAYERIKREAN